MDKGQEIETLKQQLRTIADELANVSRQLGWLAEDIYRSQEA